MAFVNQTTGSSAGAGTTVASSALSCTTGNALAVSASTYDPTSVVSGVTDTAGNTYTKKVERKTSGSVEIWVAKNITGHATNVITVTYSASVATDRFVCAAQFSGRDTSSSIANTTATANTAGGTSVTSASFNPSVAGCDVFVGVQMQGGQTAVTAGANYTNLQTVAADAASELRANAPSGAQTASMSWTTATGADLALVALQTPQAVLITGTPASVFTLSGPLVFVKNVSGVLASVFAAVGSPATYQSWLPGATSVLEEALLNSWFRSAPVYQPP